jgi:hypothetical protein
MEAMRFRCFQFRLRTLMIVVTVFCVMQSINLRPSNRRTLGHIKSNAPPIAPGLWVMGEDYGWPWTYKTEQTDLPQSDYFDRFYLWGLVGDIGVAALIALATVLATVNVLRIAIRSPVSMIPSPPDH